MPGAPPITNTAVAAVYDAYPPALRKKLMTLRALILDTAANTPSTGVMEETLKWGEPAYLTVNQSGSTIRLAWKAKAPTRYAMYFNCNTTLVETFRALYPNDFRFEGNRAIVFELHDVVSLDALAYCVAAALTYHRDRALQRKR
jgi:hypothetical protein